MAKPANRLRSPWRDRNGRFSRLKAGTLALMLAPAYAMLLPVARGEAGQKPLLYLLYYSGVWAGVLPLLTLAVTPMRRMLGWSQLILVRRMIGVSGLVYILFHFLIFLMVNEFALDDLGLEFARPTVWAATLAALLFIALALTSLDSAVARMGPKAWRQLHRLNYSATGLALLHFLLAEGAIGALPFTMAGIFFWLMGWRELERRGRGADPSALLGLALLVPVATLAFQAIWLSAYQAIPLAQTLAGALGLTPEVAAVWQLLVLGLIAALLPAALGRQPGIRLAAAQSRES